MKIWFNIYNTNEEGRFHEIPFLEKEHADYYNEICEEKRIECKEVKIDENDTHFLGMATRNSEKFKNKNLA